MSMKDDIDRAERLQILEDYAARSLEFLFQEHSKARAIVFMVGTMFSPCIFNHFFFKYWKKFAELTIAFNEKKLDFTFSNKYDLFLSSTME